MSSAGDEMILAACIDQERVIITADLDFPRLFSQLRAAGPGLVLLRGGNYSEAESLECVRRRTPFERSGLAFGFGHGRARVIA